MPKRSSRWGKSCGYALAAVTITRQLFFADAANVAGSDPRLQRHPRLYRSGVLLDGVSYLDGGVSDAIPVQEAARRGAQTIVVIRTVPSQMFYTPQWFKRMERWLGESSLQTAGQFGASSRNHLPRHPAVHRETAG